MQEEIKPAAEGEDAKEYEEQDMEEEEDEDDSTSQFQRRAVLHLTSSELRKSHLCTRRLIAEDPRWTLTIVPSLSDICIRHFADNFCC